MSKRLRQMRLAHKREQDKHRQWWFDPQPYLIAAYAIGFFFVLFRMIAQGS